MCSDSEFSILLYFTQRIMQVWMNLYDVFPQALKCDQLVRLFVKFLATYSNDKIVQRL